MKTESSKTYPYPRGLAGLEIVDFEGLNGPLLPQNPPEKVGGFAPHRFQWVLRYEGGPLRPPQIDGFRPGVFCCVTKSVCASNRRLPTRNALLRNLQYRLVLGIPRGPGIFEVPDATTASPVGFQ